MKSMKFGFQKQSIISVSQTTNKVTISTRAGFSAYLNFGKKARLAQSVQDSEAKSLWSRLISVIGNIIINTLIWGYVQFGRSILEYIRTKIF